MAERAAIHQSIQLGLESTPGTAVAAGKTLPSLDLQLDPHGEFKTYRATGQKLPRLSVLNREWVTTPTKMPITFGEQLYPLASLVRQPTITTPGGGTVTRQHFFDWNNVDADTKAFYTIEQGGSVRASRAASCFWNDGKWSFDHKSGMEFEGNIIGQKLEDAITMTATPTEIELVPAEPDMFDVYLDTTWAGLGTTKLLRWMKGEFAIGNRQDLLFPINSANAGGFAATVEDEPTIGGSMSLQADATGMGLLTMGRNTTTKFMRIKALGPLIEGSLYYMLQWDFAIQISNFKGFDNSNKTWDTMFDFIVVKDPTSGKGFEITDRCKVTAL